jgi:hypothetical protein
MENNGDPSHLPEDCYTSETIESPDDVISVKGIEDHPKTSTNIQDIDGSVNEKEVGNSESSGLSTSIVV